MKRNKTFYITTTLPYVNAEPHLGFALEIVKADVIARWHRALHEEVFFNTGVDEHGLKIYRQAQELNLAPQTYCDQMAAKFIALKDALNLSYNSFSRTTDERHLKAAQEFWRLCAANGDIYKKNYKIKYCVGCELEKTDSELVNGHCPLHPEQTLEVIDEENYFFRFSKYQQPLLAWYGQQPEFVLPKSKLNEIEKFVERGLADFSISRLKSKMPWGVGVPDDKEQVMYVWFDALINYISCLGWPGGADFKKYWPGVQICGKDNLRQQTAMWQAMLLSAGLPASRQVLVNGFVTADGQKMSKSVGNVVNPIDLVTKYGIDAVRYYLMAAMNPFEDSDFSADKFSAIYKADLADNLGNLVLRTANLLEKNNIAMPLEAKPWDREKDFKRSLDDYKFNEALALIFADLHAANGHLTKTEPWKMTETSAIKESLQGVVLTIRQTAEQLKIFLPDTGAKIAAQFGVEKITKGEPLFPHLV
jgi:methionyl-tRNA synthetase